MSYSPILLVGHYCHDTLYHSNGERSDTLGGSVSYISSVLHSLEIPSDVTSKVGTDFAYFSKIFHSPQIVSSLPTTQFIADFTHGERIEKVGAICEKIFPLDIPSHRDYEIALAVGIVGEVLPDTLKKIKSTTRHLLCDMQGLIRTIDPYGAVINAQLSDTPFHSMLEQISYLKASRMEAERLDIESVRKRTCLLVTEGKDGCVVYERDREFRVPAFQVNEVDPTGAGDCFLAGFAAGLRRGLPIEKAVRLGNYFGGLAVQYVGVPDLRETPPGLVSEALYL